MQNVSGATKESSSCVSPYGLSHPRIGSLVFHRCWAPTILVLRNDHFLPLTMVCGHHRHHGTRQVLVATRYLPLHPDKIYAVCALILFQLQVLWGRGTGFVPAS